MVEAPVGIDGEARTGHHVCASAARQHQGSCEGPRRRAAAAGFDPTS
jgi:hypothetical protein